MSNPLLETALKAAEAAAGVHLQHFRRLGVEEAEEKDKSDFVSKVDWDAQEAAIGVIRQAFPQHHVLAEEGEASGERSWPADGRYLWMVDPLDGTTNFLHGHPMFAASVAVGRAGTLKAGAVVAPRLGEKWWARSGGGAWKGNQRISVSGIRDLGRALVGTGFPFKAPALVPRYVQQLGRILQASGGVRRGGSAALDLCYLAEGIFDAFWEEEYLSPWDTAAGLLILKEAGGVSSRLDGSTITLSDGSILAANSEELRVALAGRLSPPT